MANGSLILAIDEGISALYGAIGVCGDIGNLRHAIELLETEKSRLKAVEGR